MGTTRVSGEGRSVWRRAVHAGLKVLGLFVILEPVWMLLPFAGFLYGSVLQIETLGRHPGTAWLTHFVFPVLTLGWLGPVLMAAGCGLFLAAAGQVYWAKIRKSGLVTGGFYRLVRHPQYVSLVLFGVGILLTWGRAVTFLAFFLMMFLYYYLARSEERTCRRLFGPEYERYAERTSFIIPGDRLLRPVRARLPALHLPAPLRVAGALAATLAVCFASMGLIDAVKERVRTVPYVAAMVSFGPPQEAATRLAVTGGEVAGIPFAQAGRVAVVRGPWRNAWATGFAERVLERLRQSKALQGFLAYLDEPGGDVAIIFCAPFDRPEQPAGPGMRAGGAAGGRGPAPDPLGPDRARLMILRCTLAPGASIAEALADKSKRQVRGACIAPVNLGLAETEDMVEGNVARPGPGFPAEDRWDFFLRQLAERPASGVPRGSEPVVPGRAESGRLVLVHAPILRTRLDPAFAREILDRLTGSARFRDQLRKSGVGGRVVAVAFPRPGPNWYREHHGSPQVSVFVILARLPEGAAVDALFRRGGREVLGAFIADMDFSIESSTDSVGEITLIGPRRDLEERWAFFLSGVGAAGVYHP
jgi:protein-S-isoprenylcysteine O-methyltransferase Ste14